MAAAFAEAVSVEEASISLPSGTTAASRAPRAGLASIWVPAVMAMPT